MIIDTLYFNTKFCINNKKINFLFKGKVKAKSEAANQQNSQITPNLQMAKSPTPVVKNFNHKHSLTISPTTSAKTFFNNAEKLNLDQASNVILISI